MKWFKRKLYGWGWYPASWQGWLILAAFIALNVHEFLRIDTGSHSISDTLINFLPILLISTALMIALAIRFGEKPRWQWGTHLEDKLKIKTK